MRFLRLKPRRVEAANPSEEEGQGLLHLDRGPSAALDVSSAQSKEARTEVVVLKAALHCQGCARRVKKTLSKLEGVNTFHVDLSQQKVTVIGNVCPNMVLHNVNKVVKGTEIWASPNAPNKPQADATQTF